MKVFFNKFLIKSKISIFAIFNFLLLASNNAFALSFEQTATAGSPNDTMRYVLIGLSILLLFVIIGLGVSIKVALAIKMKKIKLQKAKDIVTILMLTFATLFLNANTSFAQDAKEKVSVENAEPAGFWSTFIASTPNDTLLLMLFILLQLVVIFVLVNVQVKLLKENNIANATEKVNPLSWSNFLHKIGANNTEEEVKALDLNHDYDGIRELDNNIPKWWKLAFLGTIVIGIIYIFRMFVTGTLPDQITELENAQMLAAKEMEAYLKNAANNVDENSVVMLDGAGIAQGEALYAKNCVACHGAAGEGSVGPNLTDDAWLHKGSIKDVFYSIKYGWPEKGMKSWENDFSPNEIAQLASYVKSLHGTNPPNSKAAEGEIFKDETPVETDSGATTNEVPKESTDNEVAPKS